MLYDKIKRFLAGAPRPGFVAGFVLACLLTGGVALASAKGEGSSLATPANVYGSAGKVADQNDAGQLRIEVAAPAKLLAPDGGLEDQKGNGSGGANVQIKNASTDPIPTSTPVCALAPQTVVLVGTTAVQVPTSQLAGRRTLRVCLSIENANSPKVKCLLDGTPGMTFTPDVGVLQGDVLGPGDCYVYPVDTSHTLKCVSDTASTGVLTWEC